MRLQMAKICQMELVQLLINSMSPKALNAVNREGNPALHHAAANGYLEVVRTFLINIPNKTYYKTINALNKQKYNILHYAAENGNTAIVRLLLDNRHVSPNTLNAYTENNETSLTLAAAKGYTGIVKLLLDHNLINSSTIDARNKNCDTALTLALKGRFPDTASVLINNIKFKNFNAINRDNEESVIILTAKLGYEDLARILVTKISPLT